VHLSESPCIVTDDPTDYLLLMAAAPPNAYQALPRYMTQTEVRAFLREIRNVRDRALFSLIYLYGLRVGEAVLLERTDVDLDRARIVVKRNKGGVWTERPLFSSVRSQLDYYFTTCGEPTDALFPGRDGALKKRQIQTLFTRYRDNAGLSHRYTVHCLRHSIATHLLNAGVPLEFVQDHLGHRNIKSTSIYARITDRNRAAQFKRLESSPWIVHPGTTMHERKEESCEEPPNSDERHELFP
jgi:integrase